MRTRVLVRSIPLWVVLLHGCAGAPGATLTTPPAGATGSGSPTSTTQAGIAPAPTPGTGITLVEPTDGQVLPPGNVEITVRTTGFRLVDKIGMPAAGGEGHVLYYLGVDFVPTEPGKTARTQAGTFVPSAQTTYSWAGVNAGKYGVWVQLVNNDDTPLQPPATARVTIEVG